MPTDHYDVLGVGRDASPEEIRQAYRQLVLEHHPDRNPNDPEAAKKFTRIQDAYEELLEPERRRPVAAYHTHASIYQTVWVHRRSTRRARPSDSDNFAPPLIAMATIFWLVLVCGGFCCMEMMPPTDMSSVNASEYAVDPDEYYADLDKDNTDSGEDDADPDEYYANLDKDYADSGEDATDPDMASDLALHYSPGWFVFVVTAFYGIFVIAVVFLAHSDEAS